MQRRHARSLSSAVLAMCVCRIASPGAADELDPRDACHTLPHGVVAQSTKGLVSPGADPTTLSARERSEGWRLLFDGTGLENWTGFERDTIPSAWRVRDGALTLTTFRGEVPDRSRGAVRTVDAFDDFELRLQWAIEPGGNSGVFFHVREGVANRIWESAPELQIVDDAVGAERPAHLSGALFDVHAPVCDATKAIGEYNDTRLVVRGGHAEHWLNGYRVAEYELGSADFAARVANSKFRDLEAFAEARSGYIALQDHGSAVRFRAIRIRALQDR